MAAVIASPVGSPFASYGDENSPQFVEWLRRQAMDQAIRDATAQAQARTAYGYDIGSNPAAIGPLPQQPVSQPQVAPQQMLQGMEIPPQAPQLQPGQLPAPQAPAQQLPAAAQPQPPMADTFGGANQPPGYAGPVRDEADRQNRRQGWINFIEQVKSNPDLQMGLVRFATQLMQPVAPGQNQLGHLGSALQGSIDYVALNKQRRAELEAKGVGTELTGAQAATERERPAAIRAGVEGTQASTGLAREQTARLKVMTPVEKAQVQAEIDRLKKSLNLTDAQIREINADAGLKEDPEYKKATIELLKARAWHEKNPGAAVSAQLAARQGHRQAMLPFIMATDPDVQAARTPEEKTAIANLKADATWFAAGVKLNQVSAQAEAAYDIEYAHWKSDEKAQKDYPTWEEYLRAHIHDIMASSQDKEVRREMANVYRRRAGKALKGFEEPKESSATQPSLSTDPAKKDKRPPLSSFER